MSKRAHSAVRVCLVTSANPLRRSCMRLEELSLGAVRICLDLGELFSAGIVRVERSCCGAFFRCSRMVFGSCLVVCAPAFALAASRRGLDSPLVRASSGSRRAIPKYQSKSKVRKLRSCSSGWKMATLEYKSTTQRAFPQLRLKSRVKEHCSSGMKIVIF